MTDRNPSEDEAVLYLLDRLSAAERCEFEARLAESAELRALLRELEDGSAALALATPPRRPPVQVWERIERAVARDRKREPVTHSFWFGWWRYGWAVAVACVAGWLWYALWLDHSRDSGVAGFQRSDAQRASTPSESRGSLTSGAEKPLSPASRNETSSVVLEVAGLRHHVAELSNRIASLSQSLAQQESVLSETNRLKFFQLTAAAEMASATNPPVSADLQWALFLAMARELGWSPTGKSGENATGGIIPGWRASAQHATATNIAGVDFADLRTGSNAVANPSAPRPTESLPAVANQPESPSTAASSTVPGFTSGTNAFLAFDSTVATPGATLTFWNGTAGQMFQFIGSSVLGSGPMVVAVPFSSANGATLTVIAGTAAGSSNVLGQFPPPSTPP